MPCETYTSGEQLQEAQLELSRLTAITCEMAGLLHDEGLLEKLGKKARAWVAQHDAEDQERERDRKLRAEHRRQQKQALRKLTARERRVLGLR
jgi:hypothetical protein